jgi:hypothetical protein
MFDLPLWQVSITVRTQTYSISEEPTPRALSSAEVQLMGPSGAAVWSFAVKEMIYVTTGDNYPDPPSENSDAILGLSAVSGQLAWARQYATGSAATEAPTHLSWKSLTRLPHKWSALPK